MTKTAKRRITTKGWPGSVIFVILFVVIACLTGITSLIDKPPQGVHIWRQTDCLAITLNYFNGRARFAEPEILNLLSDEHSTGKSAGEFPLLYFSVAQLWKITGQSEAVYRMVMLLLTFTGLLALFRITLSLTLNIIWALFTALIPLTFPVFANYSVSFLPNIPAIAFTLIGWYLLITYLQRKKRYLLWIAASLFATGMLLKISAGISLVAIVLFILTERFFTGGGKDGRLTTGQGTKAMNGKDGRLTTGQGAKAMNGKDGRLTTGKESRMFSRPVREIIPFIFGLMAVAAWYLWAARYNSIHGGRYTFNSVWPVWELSLGEIRERLTDARIIWKNQIMAEWLLIVSALVWVTTVVFIKRLPLFIRYLILVIPAGTLIYMLLWFQGLRDHDYYYAELYIPVIVSWIALFALLKGSGRVYKSIINSLLATIVIISALNCRQMMKERSDGWMNSWYRENLEALYIAGSEMNSLGIGENSVIVSIPDPSINSSLYFLRRRGFTDFGNKFTDPGDIARAISKGAEYLVVNDTTLLTNSAVSQYSAYPCAAFQNIRLFDLKPYR